MRRTERTLPPATRRRTLLVITQGYVPDPGSFGQHLADVLPEVVRRGWRVVLFTPARGHDDASLRYPSREVIDGVEVRRLPASSFGKRSMELRVLAGLSFMTQCALRGLFVRDLSVVLVATAPLASFAALCIAALRGAALKYWVLDINPDQLIALGWLREGGPVARLWEWLNGRVLRRAADVLVLDRFMGDRLSRKADRPINLHVVTPWPLEDHLAPVDPAANPFRAEHDLNDRFVILYSGNHGVTTPVSTLLGAALELRDLENLLFLFIGGGYGKLEVERFIHEHGDGNVRSLPYQPLSRIRYSLSAGDVHAVTMSDDVVGIIHPSKIYCAMGVGRPLLAVGPRPSPLSEIVDRYGVGWCVANGDVDGAARTIREIVATDRVELERMGRRAQRVAAEKFGKEDLLGRVADVLVEDVAAPSYVPSRAG